MWNGKKKAVTFSYDDGVTQDCRLVEMMNTYGVKGTFNLNSGMQSYANVWEHVEGSARAYDLKSHTGQGIIKNICIFLIS